MAITIPSVAGLNASSTTQSVTFQPTDKPQRIVSLNLCADQLLLALADREQIAGLTPNADKPQMSAISSQVGSLRVLKGSAEEVLEIKPDLLIGMPARRSAGMTVLTAQNYPTFDLQRSESFPELREQTLLMAQAIGHRERGEALIMRMERDLATLPKPRDAQGKVAAYYQRRGFMTGTGTLIDDMMQRIGLVNLATRLNKPALSQLSIEEMVAAKPDYIIVEESTNIVTDHGTEMLHHPALRNIPRISLPQSWTVCGGPTYVQAAKSLARQVMAIEKAKALSAY